VDSTTSANEECHSNLDQHQVSHLAENGICLSSGLSRWSKYLDAGEFQVGGWGPVMEVTDPVIYAISAGLVAGINHIAAVEKRSG
jgi:hypothetical protein